MRKGYYMFCDITYKYILLYIYCHKGWSGHQRQVLRVAAAVGTKAPPPPTRCVYRTKTKHYPVERRARSHVHYTAVRRARGQHVKYL